ncbi:hypothetical protein ACHAPA_008615 [Fusarium lateritium]
MIRKLVESSDVFVENYLPGSLAKYGLDYATLSKINPRLIYASITGYGQSGPYSNRAGYDVMVEAEMGLMHITGSRDGPPVKVGCAVTDLTTGMYATTSILSALFERVQSNQGQQLDICLSDCQVATLSNMAQSVLVTGQRDTGRWGTAHRKPDWATDERFASNTSRVKNRDWLENSIEEITKTRNTKEWLEVFDGSGLPYAKVNDLLDTVNHTHVRARNMIVKIQHPKCGPLSLISPPVKYSRTNPTIRTPPPTLGEHTDEVLRSVLNINDDDIILLRSEGVVG